MKVLTIISKLEMGGIEKTLLSCLPHLSSKGVEIFVLCDVGGQLDDEYKKCGAKIISFNGQKKPFFDARRLKEVLRNEKFDIVHSRYGHTSGLFAKVCHDLGVPLIVSIHNEKAMFRNNWKNNPILNKVRNLYLSYHKYLTIKYAKIILGHSKTNLNYFQDCPNKYKKKLQVIYNGVDYSKFLNYPALKSDRDNNLQNIRISAQKIFVHIGKFKEQKNHKFLIDIFKRLNATENNYHLMLLGEGPLINNIKDYVVLNGLEHHVHFIGLETNIAPYLRVSDVFLFPSIYEGFGNVLLEAQYAKLIIGASNIAPHYEATYNGYHQFFYDPYDLEEAVSKIQKLINSKLDIKEEAFNFSSAFTIEKMSDELYKYYQQVIRKML